MQSTETGDPGFIRVVSPDKNTSLNKKKKSAVTQEVKRESAGDHAMQEHFARK